MIKKAWTRFLFIIGIGRSKKFEEAARRFDKTMDEIIDDLKD